MRQGHEMSAPIASSGHIETSEEKMDVHEIRIRCHGRLDCSVYVSTNEFVLVV